MERNIKRKKGPHVQMYQEGPKPLPKNQLPLWRDVGLALGYATNNFSLKILEKTEGE